MSAAPKYLVTFVEELERLVSTSAGRIMLERLVSTSAGRIIKSDLYDLVLLTGDLTQMNDANGRFKLHGLTSAGKCVVLVMSPSQIMVLLSGARVMHQIGDRFDLILQMLGDAPEDAPVGWF